MTRTLPARLPPPVVAGARIGVAALSGPIAAERLERGLATLVRLGFEPVPADNLALRVGLFAGSDRERLAAFHRLAADPTIEAIVFARGGHGSLRVLEGIDWKLLARFPRAYMGFSDLTPFLLEVVRRLGLVAYHGPMVAADLARDLSSEDEGSFLAALAGQPEAEHPVELVDGDAPVEGVLTGGCLSLLTATLGTPFAPRLERALLVWEDVAEPSYRLDRMLTHLYLSGSLAGVRAMIAGRVRGRDEDPLTPPAALGWMRSWFDGPIGWGLAMGHEAPNRTFPLGLEARFDPGARRLTIDVASAR